ncbi:MAG: phosphoglycerate kinase [Kiritimatiellae bacterium]|nr:phosphoglycerate kinase [Kiritimatiellia bacterium]
MPINFDDVRQLQNATVKPGDTWLYSADFNTPFIGEPHAPLRPKNADRLDSECEDIRQIADSGGIVLILAHQGRWKGGSADHLNTAADYLGRKLGHKIVYCLQNNTPLAYEYVDQLEPGQIIVMGNVRFHEGEEKNDAKLAAQFADLVRRPGNAGRAAIGGFGKAHRANASNVGLLQFVPGYLTRSQVREMRQLEAWAGAADEYSVAVLGGVKKEKITDGLTGFCKTYDAVIPGGIVLNTIYLAQGKQIGDSIVKDGDKRFDGVVKPLLESKESAAKICVPDEVIIASPAGSAFRDSRRIAIDDGVPAGFQIVDFVLPDSALKALDTLGAHGGRLVLAGTPGIYLSGFTVATDAILATMNRPNVNAIALGGDTAAEVRFEGPSSTGGGAALHFVAAGTTAVFEALKANKTAFSNA